MANQTANREPNRQEGKQLALKANNVHFYRGAAVCYDDATGFLVHAANTAGQKTAGVVAGERDLTAEAAGAGRVEVYREGVFQFVYGPGGATDALAGDNVYWSDNQTVKPFDAGAGAVNILAGQIVEVVSATQVRVLIKVGA